MSGHVEVKAQRTGDAITAISHVLDIAKASNINIVLDMGQGIRITVRHDSNAIDLAIIYELELENLKFKKEVKE